MITLDLESCRLAGEASMTLSCRLRELFDRRFGAQDHRTIL